MRHWKYRKNQNNEELAYLESVLNALENAKEDADLSEIRTELAESGSSAGRHRKKDSRSRKGQSPCVIFPPMGMKFWSGKAICKMTS